MIDAALSVGRDPTPWLKELPALAWSEIIARRSPLVAYLGRQPHPGGTGFRAEPNVIYRDGTERSARGAFGYRIGMTMAEWACRGLMGLGPTTHAEADTPADAGPAWDPAGSLPDLFGEHPAGPTTWLIEAKGGKKLTLRELRKGVRQLSTPGLLTGDHVRVLCGTSLEPHLFVSVDLEEHVGNHPSPRQHIAANPANDDEALLALARSRMLLYLALTAIPETEWQIVPVGLTVGAVADRSRGGTVTLLEYDPTTRQERIAAQDRERYERRDGRERRDMLTGRVPGTDLIIGISRRLFAACRNLAAVQWDVATAVGGEADLPGTSAPEAVDTEQLDVYDELRRTLYRQGMRDRASRAAEATRTGFEDGERSTWASLFRLPIPFRLAIPDGLLEAATADTYLAIDARTMI